MRAYAPLAACHAFNEWDKLCHCDVFAETRYWMYVVEMSSFSLEYGALDL